MTKSKAIRHRALVTGTSVAAMLVAGGAAVAQSADTRVIEEVIVTAQKRTESVQDVPVSITAFDANFTKRVNIDDVKDLVKFAPGFSGDSKDSFIDYINIRGISTNDFGVGGDPSVGFFKNGLYQGRNGVVVSSMFDMDRAEVLRGPQGFLFGRNAIGGAISLYTAKPDFGAFSGHVDGGIGERGILEGEVAVNLPVTDNFALRIAGYHSEENGYAYNYYDGEKYVWHNKDAVRATAGFVGEKWDANLMFEYEDREQSGSIYRALNDDALEYLAGLSDIIGNPVPQGSTGDLDSDHGLGNFDIGQILTLSAEINIDLGFATLTSLTGYKDHDYSYAEDFDGMPVQFNDYGQEQTGDYFEQELRLISQSDGPLSWYAGVSYYQENITATFDNASNADVLCAAYYEMTCSDMFAYYGYGDFDYGNGHHERNKDDGNYKGWAAYLDLTYAISDRLDLDVGLRYTKDKKDFGLKIYAVQDDLGPFLMFTNWTQGYIRESKTWDDFSPRVILRYHPDDNWMIYGSVTKGYKSGGYNSFGLLVDEDLWYTRVTGADAALQSFDPEIVWSYEVGAKGDMLNKKLRVDVSSYYYRYSDLQLNYWDSGAKVDNVGKVKAFGIEGTAQAILGEYFDLFVAASYNHNKVSDAEDIEEGSTGNRLTGVPKFTLAGVLSYNQPVTDTGAVTAAVEFRTQAKTYSGLANLENTANGAWTDVSARVGYADDAAGWSVTAYVENVFNEKYFDGTSDGGFPFPAHGFGVSRPRTFGVKFSKEFGG